MAIPSREEKGHLYINPLIRSGYLHLLYLLFSPQSEGRGMEVGGGVCALLQPYPYRPFPRPCPYRNCSSGRWENAPSWISEKAAFTSVLQGTLESVQWGLCRDWGRGHTR